MLLRHEASSSQITVVPNGIVLPDFNSLTPTEEVRAYLKVKEDMPVVVCVARLEKEKDISTLIAAMDIVIKVKPTTRCFIAGEGMEKGSLSKQIDTLNLSRSVSLLGFVKDSLSLINAADLFVLPSLAEPFGLAVIEAMSLGKTVIATKVGGPIEIITEETGLLVPPSNPQHLAQAILCLLENHQNRIAMGKSGQVRVHQNYTARHMAQATASVYQKITKYSKIKSSST